MKLVLSNPFEPPRLIDQLWGTTTIQDCLVALKFGLKKRELVQGPILMEYEREFARQVGVRFAVSFASGRAAFFALLKSFQINDGEEVLLQAQTHIVVPNAVRFAGGKPVFVDCDLDTLNMNLERVSQKITSRTRFLVIQHTFGVPVELDSALTLAKEYNLILIEDCVHALGATYKGCRVGSFGQAAFFSTEETKIISSTMGGMAVTDDPVIAERLRDIQECCAWPEQAIVWRCLLKLVIYHLFTQPLLHRFTRPVYMWLRKNLHVRLGPVATSNDEMFGRQPAGYMQRLSNGQACVALRQLRRLDVNIQHRRAIARAFRDEFSKRGFHIVKPPIDSQPAYVRYPIMVSDRSAAIEAVSNSVILGQWFSSVLEESASPEFGGYILGSCPNAELVAKHLVNVPTHFRIRLKDVKPIVNGLGSFVWKPND